MMVVHALPSRIDGRLFPTAQSRPVYVEVPVEFPADALPLVEKVAGSLSVLLDVRPIFPPSLLLWRVIFSQPLPSGQTSLLVQATSPLAPDTTVALHVARQNVSLAPRPYVVEKRGDCVLLVLEDPGDETLPTDWMFHASVRERVVDWVWYLGHQRIPRLAANSWANNVLVQQRLESWCRRIWQAFESRPDWLLPEAVEQARSWCRQHAALVRRLAPHSLWLVHGDLKPDHIRIAPGGRLVAFNWRRAGYGHPAFDLWDLVWHLEDDRAWETLTRIVSLFPADMRRSFARPLIHLTGVLKAFERLADAASDWIQSPREYEASRAALEGAQAACRLVAWSEAPPA